MSIYHDEIEIEDMEYDDEFEMYYYPCPCGDKFQISKVGTNGKHTILLQHHALGYSFGGYPAVDISPLPLECHG